VTVDVTIPILKLGKVLLVNVHVELDDEIASRLQNDTLEAIERAEAEGLVVDITGLEVVDSYVARILAETGQMAKLMGTRTVVVGMRPEVAATLTRMGYAMNGVQTALNLEEGLALLGYQLSRV
jgi:rsbT antagonist protein RsbS